MLVATTAGPMESNRFMHEPSRSFRTTSGPTNSDGAQRICPLYRLLFERSRHMNGYRLYHGFGTTVQGELMTTGVGSVAETPAAVGAEAHAPSSAGMLAGGIGSRGDGRGAPS